MDIAVSSLDEATTAAITKYIKKKVTREIVKAYASCSRDESAEKAKRLAFDWINSPEGKKFGETLYTAIYNKLAGAIFNDKDLLYTRIIEEVKNKVISMYGKDIDRVLSNLISTKYMSVFKAINDMDDAISLKKKELEHLYGLVNTMTEELKAAKAISQSTITGIV